MDARAIMLGSSDATSHSSDISTGVLLWPAVAEHAMVAVLLALGRRGR